jgi:hypothetical protein
LYAEAGIAERDFCSFFDTTLNGYITKGDLRRFYTISVATIFQERAYYSGRRSHVDNSKLGVAGSTVTVHHRK